MCIFCNKIEDNHNEGDDFLEEHGEKFPYDPTPMAHAHFGQPEDVSDLINKYGTYNIQPTNEQENTFPAIMQALPSQWHDKEVTKD